jgi:hypothetical protein
MAHPNEQLKQVIQPIYNAAMDWKPEDCKTHLAKLRELFILLRDYEKAPELLPTLARAMYPVNFSVRNSEALLKNIVSELERLQKAFPG